MRIEVVLQPSRASPTHTSSSSAAGFGNTGTPASCPKNSTVESLTSQCMSHTRFFTASSRSNEEKQTMSLKQNTYLFFNTWNEEAAGEHYLAWAGLSQRRRLYTHSTTLLRPGRTCVAPEKQGVISAIHNSTRIADNSHFKEIVNYLTHTVTVILIWSRNCRFDPFYLPKK